MAIRKLKYIRSYSADDAGVNSIALIELAAIELHKKSEHYSENKDYVTLLDVHHVPAVVDVYEVTDR